MNILPKKRWHVRTRENIARVRADEAKAAEEEKCRKIRAQKAETEARINLLRERARSQHDGREGSSSHTKAEPSQEKHEHINFFQDLEEGRVDHHKPNTEHEAEVKSEKEKYEKQIGYLTYLGQNTNEATGMTSWYEKMPHRLIDTEPMKQYQEQKKILHDPMTDIKRYLSIMGGSHLKNDVKVAGKFSKKHQLHSDSDSDDKSTRSRKKSKKSKNHKSTKMESMELQKSSKSNVDIEKLRASRLLREQKEKLKAEALIAKLRGDTIPVVKTEKPKHTIHQKYHSQFFPEIARQNTEKSARR